MKVLNSIADAVGNTPLIRLSRLYPNFGRDMHILAKCEFMNPGGSVKDRIAFYMVQQAELEGSLKPGQLIVEATGGNTGIGLALVCKLTGHQLVCVMTEKVGKEKVRTLEALGAEAIVVPPGKPITDPEHFINVGRRVTVERNGWFVDQFENKHNRDAHYKFTGPEIWEQTEGKVDALVAGIGTGGTLCGAGKFLKEKKPSVQLILADPVGSSLSDWHHKKKPSGAPYLVEGIGGDFLPGNFDMEMIDHSFYVSDKESIDTARKLLDREGIFAGSSSGCVLAAAEKFCNQRAGRALNVVAVLPDTGRLYTNTIFDDEWLHAKLV